MKSYPNHVKYNSLKNALYLSIQKPMPCVRNCPFTAICSLHDDIYGRDSKTMYAGSCPIETALHSKLSRDLSLQKYTDVPDKLKSEFITLYIGIERIRKQVSLCPELITDHNTLSKATEVLLRLQKKFIKVAEDIIDASNRGGESEIAKVGENDRRS